MMDSPIDTRCWGQAGVLDKAFEQVYPASSIIGLVGNVFMLLTIRYGSLKESPYVYLKCIAIADILFLLVTLSLTVVFCQVCQFTLRTAYYLQQYYWYAYAAIAFSMKSWHNLLLLSLTIERFIYVRWPLKTRSWCTRGRAKKVCIAVFLLSLSSESLKVLNTRVVLMGQNMVKLEPDFWIKDFNCAPNFDSAITNNRYTCYSRDIPVGLQSNETDPGCSYDLVKSRKFGSSLRELPRTNESLYTLNCLHQYCTLPQIPENLTYQNVQVDQTWNYLSSSYEQRKLMILSNRKWNKTSLLREPLIGKSMLLNGECFFVLSPHDLKSVLKTTINFESLEHGDVVYCPLYYPRRKSGWQMLFPLYYGRIMLCVRLFCTGVLAVFNIFVVIEVRRANRRASDLANDKQDLSLKRRAEENRLTWSLITLSTLRILTDVVQFTCAPPIERLIYTDYHPPGPYTKALEKHMAISNFLHLAEKSSVFYLLAFINRKFSETFLKQVLYGKLKLHKLCGILRMLLPKCSRKAPQGPPEGASVDCGPSQRSGERRSSYGSSKTSATSPGTPITNSPPAGIVHDPFP